MDAVYTGLSDMACTENGGLYDIACVGSALSLETRKVNTYSSQDKRVTQTHICHSHSSCCVIASYRPCRCYTVTLVFDTMGKGLDTCLVVQPMVVQTVDPTEVVITERKKKLVQMMTTTDPGTPSSAPLLRQARCCAIIGLVAMTRSNSLLRATPLDRRKQQRICRISLISSQSFPRATASQCFICCQRSYSIGTRSCCCLQNSRTSWWKSSQRRGASRCPRTSPSQPTRTRGSSWELQRLSSASLPTSCCRYDLRSCTWITLFL